MRALWASFCFRYLVFDVCLTFVISSSCLNRVFISWPRTHWGLARPAKKNTRVCKQPMDETKTLWSRCWAVQMGLLTPLTFARHCLSPLAAFTSGVYFHHGRWWQSICKFYTANFNDIFGCLESECVWQQAITCCLCYRMPQNAFFPWTSNLLVSQKMTQRHFFQPSTLFPW